MLELSVGRCSFEHVENDVRFTARLDDLRHENLQIYYMFRSLQIYYIYPLIPMVD